MNWQQLEKTIRDKIQPGHRGILKCRGDERRPIVSNDGNEIAVRTGVKTRAAKVVTYEMIKYAYDRIVDGEEFDSDYYRRRYDREYSDAPCRYSVVGGILVEIGEAERLPSTVASCVYRRKSS